MISPWLGSDTLPDWMPQYRENIAPLAQYGFDFLIPTDREDFYQRCEERLGVTMPREFEDPRKLSEAYPALGVIYADRIAGYDFWGYTGMDVVFGRLDRWVTPELLSGLDVFSIDVNPPAVSGCFSLFRNCEAVNELFRTAPGWREQFEDRTFHGFDEAGFAEAVRRSDLRQMYRYWQAHDNQPGQRPPQIELRIDGTLYDRVRREEVMMYHFRQTKRWPC